MWARILFLTKESTGNFFFFCLVKEIRWKQKIIIIYFFWKKEDIIYVVDNKNIFLKVQSS